MVSGHGHTPRTLPIYENAQVLQLVFVTVENPNSTQGERQHPQASCIRDGVLSVLLWWLQPVKLLTVAQHLAPWVLGLV